MQLITSGGLKQFYHHLKEASHFLWIGIGGVVPLDSPPKTNMEPENHPFGKEKHLLKPSFWGSMLRFNLHFWGLPCEFSGVYI